jgi:hypothetical protein
MGPVFLFGTGRCGSTHLQRLISLNTEVWVWGEHDGFLNPLLRSLKFYETSPNMKRFVFDAPSPADDAALVAQVRGETAMLSWVNRIDVGTLRAELRGAIERMFASRLPRGWTGWGFKEVRYGGPDDVPAILLDMFPTASAAFSFREPAETISSMVRTWNPDMARNPARHGEIRALFDFHAKRWLEAMVYFIALKRDRRLPVVFLDVASLSAPPARLLAALRLSPRPDRPVTPVPHTNRGPANIPDSAQRPLAECFAPWREQMTDLYRAALDLCERLPD